MNVKNNFQDDEIKTSGNKKDLSSNAFISDRGAQEYVTFYVGQQFMGVSIKEVKEVLLCREICSVPAVSKNIAGILNLRGQIVTVIDMHAILDIEPQATPIEDISTSNQDQESNDEDPNTPGGKEYKHVIIQHGSDIYSFQADEVGDVLSITENSIDEPPSIMNSNWQQCCQGVIHINNEMLALLKTEQLIKNLIDEVLVQTPVR